MRKWQRRQDTIFPLRQSHYRRDCIIIWKGQISYSPPYITSFEVTAVKAVAGIAFMDSNMTDHFLRLFGYDHYANRLMLLTIREAGSPENALSLMGHVLTASRVWQLRCEGKSSIGIPLWPEEGAPTEPLEQALDKRYQEWKVFVEQENDFSRVVTYQNQSGKPYGNLLSDLMMQVINHGTHHRAQMGQWLKAAGVSLPGTDYILYLRSI